MVLPAEWDAEGFRQRLTRARVAANLSQKALGELMFESQTYVSNWENGHTQAKGLDVLTRFAEVLGVSADYLLGLSDTPRGRRGDDLPADVVALVELYGALTELGKEEANEELRRIAAVDEERKNDDAMREAYAALFDAILTDEEKEELADAILAARAGDSTRAAALALRLRRRLGLGPKN